VSIPENAYLNRRGDNWSCEHGFAKVALACVAIVVPENAHVSAAGNAWECNQPYRAVDDACIRIR
jgi:hypothetical protein